MPYFSHDDIAQIGTPPGNALLGAIRVSGDQAFDILAHVAIGLKDVLAQPVIRSVHDCQLSLALHTQADGGVRECRCPARVFLMPAPHSYTRENVVELHLPGSGALLRAAMAALTRAGARPAAPGEFTFRAFRSGRLSLAQAEAVEEVIRAGTDAERRVALARLGEHAVGQVREWRDSLMDIAASIEAALDFSDEDLQEDVLVGLGVMANSLEKAGLEVASSESSVARSMPHVALVGLTNAGKSSLLNTLLREDAVLVSAEASTTRDSVRKTVCWHGAELMLSDNPGYDAVTQGSGGDAAALAFTRMGGEEVAVWVIDASQPLERVDEAFLASLSGGVVVALNKGDLPLMVAHADVERCADRIGFTLLACVETSAISEDGVEALKECLARVAWETTMSCRWNRRELLELRAALECCRAACAELNGAGRLELVVEDVRRGIRCFSRAMGEDYAEEALGRIFSRFCIGK